MKKNKATLLYGVLLCFGINSAKAFTLAEIQVSRGTVYEELVKRMPKLSVTKISEEDIKKINEKCFIGKCRDNVLIATTGYMWFIDVPILEAVHIVAGSGGLGIPSEASEFIVAQLKNVPKKLKQNANE